MTAQGPARGLGCGPPRGSGGLEEEERFLRGGTARHGGWVWGISGVCLECERKIRG